MLKELTEALGRRIREAREEKDLTQKELGDELGYTPMAISHFENGIREMKASDVQKLATFFGKDLAYFFSAGQTLFRVDTDSPHKNEMEKSISDFDRYLQQLPE